MKRLVSGLVAVGLAQYLVPQAWAQVTTSPVAIKSDYSSTVICSGDPWYDVRCLGAVGDGTTDDSAAINGACVIAIANNYSLYLPRKTFKINSAVSCAVGAGRFTIISDGATLDGSTLTAAASLTLLCGSTPANNCVYTRIEGLLEIRNAATGNTAFQFGRSDLSDSFNRPYIDNLIVTQSGTSGSACQLNRINEGDFGLYCVSSTGGGDALQLQQVTASRFRKLLAQSPNRALTLATSSNFGNTFWSPVLTGGGTCLTISSASSGNTIISPYMSGGNCGTAINATAGNGNTLISPTYTLAALGVNTTGINIVTDFPTGKFASVPSSVTLPEISVGGAGANMGVTAVDMIPVTEPAAPSSGWRWFVDSVTGRLRAKNSAGAVRTLAIP